MPTTELVVLSLKPGSEIGDPENNAAVVLKQTCETLVHRDGCQQVHFAMVMEDSSKLRLMIDWDSLEKHQEFMSSEAYGPFKRNIGSICTGPPNVVHVDFKPEGSLDAVLQAPVTELVTFYFDGGVPTDYGSGITKVHDALGQIPDAKGVAWGSTHETLEHEGNKGTAAVLAIGWTSKEHHMQFRQTQLFKDLGPHIRSTSKGAQMQHMQVMKFVE